LNFSKPADPRSRKKSPPGKKKTPVEKASGGYEEKKVRQKGKTKSWARRFHPDGETREEYPIRKKMAGSKALKERKEKKIEACAPDHREGLQGQGG